MPDLAWSVLKCFPEVASFSQGLKELAGCYVLGCGRQKQQGKHCGRREHCERLGPEGGRWELILPLVSLHVLLRCFKHEIGVL